MRKILILFIVIITSISFGQKKIEEMKSSFSEKEKSSDPKESEYIVTNTSYFPTLVRFENEINAVPIIIAKTQTHKYLFTQEGVESEIIVRALRKQNNGYKNIWEIKEKYFDGDVYKDNFYRLSLPGCCSAPTQYKYYTIATGKYLLSSTSEVLQIYDRTKATENQILVTYTEDLPDNIKRDDNVIGAILCYDANKSTMVYYLVKTKTKDYYFFPKMYFYSEKQNLTLSYSIIENKAKDYNLFFEYDKDKSIQFKFDSNGLQLKPQQKSEEIEVIMLK